MLCKISTVDTIVVVEEEHATSRVAMVYSDDTLLVEMEGC